MLILAHAALWLWYSSDDEAKLVLYAGVGFVVGILVFVRGFRMLQRKRLILDTPTARVHSAAIGLVELNGLAVGPYTLTSPITMRPSFYYRTALWHEVGEGKNRHWELAVDERFHVPFFLKDQTGMVLVNPHGAELDIHCDFSGTYHTSMFSGGMMPPRVAEFAGANGVSLSRPLKVEEYCLKPSNALYVLGTLATNPGLTAAPAPVPTLLPAANISNLDFGGWRSGVLGMLAGLASVKAGAARQKPLPTFSPGPAQLTDIDRKLAERRAGQFAPGDGEGLTALDRKIAAHHAAEQAAQPKAAPSAPTSDAPDPRLRSAAVLAATAANPAAIAAVAAVSGGSLPQTVAQSLGAAAPPAKDAPKPAPGLGDFAVNAQEETFPEKCPTVLCKGENNPAFYISWRSQKEIVKDLSLRSTLFIFGGPALSALCLWYMLAYFHAL